MSSPLLQDAVDLIRARWPQAPQLAIILGTGLGHLAEQMEQSLVIPYREIPGFPQSSALAHKGELVCGRWQNKPLIMLRGRSHVYEGYSFEQLMFPTQVLAAVGIQNLIVTNAAGGLNVQFRAGDLMLMEDHLNFMFRHSRSEVKCLRFGSSRPNYDPQWRDDALALALNLGIPLQRGVYVGVTGPNYETRAEYRAFRKIGGDAVGMSTLPEVIAATEAGLRVLGFSAITNVAKPDAPELVNAQEVVDVANHVAPKLARLLAELVARCD
jgi:purine-nucleoside phosphorylase